MVYEDYIFEREQKHAYNTFARELLIDTIISKNKQIQELHEKLNNLNKMYIAKSGRRYRTIPQNIDLEVWDAMSVEERMIHLGILAEEERKEPSTNYHLVCHKCGETYWSEDGFPEPQLCDKCFNIVFKS